MDVKNALNSILPLNLRTKDPVDRNIKMDSATDRDANGQQQYSQNQQQREPMSDEQFEQHLESIKSLQAVKDHQLSVEVVIESERRFVLLKDTKGAIVRRISEWELWDLPISRQGEPPQKGQLIRRTA